MNFEEIIGQWINKDTGEAIDTSWGTIHYDDYGGWHIVPEYPH